MFKLAAVTIDWFDDNGETLKKKFPAVESLPDIIKEADLKPKEKLANEQFALVAIDGGHVFRKYACHDPGATAMSVIYFMEHGDKLPEGAQKLAATNLMTACITHGLTPPPAITKIADASVFLETPPPRQNMAHITGQAPAPIIKEAKPESSEDYAVILPDGSRHYPISTWDQVKQAEAYFQNECRRMVPEIRRQYAVKLAAKAQHMGFPISKEILELGATTYGKDGHLKLAVEMRKIACVHDHSIEFLDELFEKRASIEPEHYAECLRRFDINEGFDPGWDHVILDPWASTFGINKQAAVVWEEGADRVTDDALRNLADNHLDLVINEQFTDHFAEEFRQDPVGIFNSMPTPQKKIIARMASDSESLGGSEAGGNVR